MNQLADDFILSMNRAAEDACNTAAPIFVKAIKEMSITDGINILKGNETAATTYLKSKTEMDLKASFSPIIKTSLDKVDATKYWEKIINTYNAIPLTKKMNPDLIAYVTDKSMNGIYSEIASQEKEIRANPLARTSALLKSVFEKK
jgi:GTPase Era involved in 16S rRNA processing